MALAGPNLGSGHRNFPAVDLDRRYSGPEAIRALGTGLPGVARSYGMESASLHFLLQTDRTLNVDHKGRLHYVEPGLTANATGITAPTAQALAPLADTFRLHSRPGAAKVIYLDFNGHVLTGTAWNVGHAATISAPAWSLDSDAANFSDTERTRIQYIWQRIAEDYAPFNVDVTTEMTDESILTRSSTSDAAYGIRVLISPISAAVGFSSAGGVAYVGAFDDVGDYYKPALVFPENLGPNGESYIAEAAAHEAGHTFNLNHDGRTSPSEGYYAGQGVWAPIMGVGYYKTLVQWSKGEYNYANNKQDDLATIASYLGFRADDHGNTPVTATYFPTGTTLQSSGVIANSEDIDVFAFATGAGNVTLNIVPDSRSANLDILATVSNTSGTVVATSNPLGALGASFNLNLPAGTYFLAIRGTGEGEAKTTGYSSYGSVGQYFINGTVATTGPQTPVATPLATPSTVGVGGNIVFDGSGSFDPDGGSILSYQWTFSDGASASTANVTRTLGTAGNFTATLTVSDNEGQTASATIPYNVNTPPTAVISTSPGTSGVTPFAVTLSGILSSDPDAGDSIVSYQWNFGDGSTGSGSSVAKTFTTPGTYSVKLTVLDTRGSSSSTQTPIVVTGNNSTVLKVTSITLTSAKSRNGSILVQATVKVTDLNNNPISGVVVSGSWSGMITGNSSATTGNSGSASMIARSSTASGTVGFAVTGVSKSGFSYDATKSVTSMSASF